MERVRAALSAAGIDRAVVELDRSTRTAADAAAALDCDVAQIVKSLVFRAASGTPVLVVASGAGRVDEALVGAAIGEEITQADAAFVRERTGFPIGGVAPVGHVEAPVVLVDADLMALDVLWAAGGTPSAVFTLSPVELVAITGGRIVRVR